MSKKTKRLRAVKGMHDMYPPISRRLHQVERLGHDLLQAHGYSEVRTPLVEYTPLFARSIGDDTDIVEKEMYTFDDRDGRSLTMRPEGTASVVRAYVEHGLHKIEPVTRWYYLGPMFRHERAQRGRQRQFYQLGVEALGVGQPGIDAEMITMLVDLLGRCGLTSMEVHLNSLGCAECRPRHRAALLAYLAPHQQQLCEDCQRRVADNPLRVLDCKVDGCRAIADGAPTSLDLLCEPCKGHWDGVIGDLEILEVPRRINHRLVRGLDYYTRTTFEVLSNEGNLGSQNTIAGGGRYDGLVQELGGPATPAIGFAMGLERLLLALGAERPPVPPVASVCLVTHGEPARCAAVALARSLRGQGISVELDHRGVSVKSQMKRANKLGCELALLLGDGELERGVISVREMATSTQEEVPMETAAEYVLGKYSR